MRREWVWWWYGSDLRSVFSGEAWLGEEFGLLGLYRGVVGIGSIGLQRYLSWIKDGRS